MEMWIIDAMSLYMFTSVAHYCLCLACFELVSRYYGPTHLQFTTV